MRARSLRRSSAQESGGRCAAERAHTGDCCRRRAAVCRNCPAPLARWQRHALGQAVATTTISLTAATAATGAAAAAAFTTVATARACRMRAGCALARLAVDAVAARLALPLAASGSPASAARATARAAVARASAAPAAPAPLTARRRAAPAAAAPAAPRVRWIRRALPARRATQRAACAPALEARDFLGKVKLGGAGPGGRAHLSRVRRPRLRLAAATRRRVGGPSRAIARRGGVGAPRERREPQRVRLARAPRSNARAALAAAAARVPRPRVREKAFAQEGAVAWGGLEAPGGTGGRRGEGRSRRAEAGAGDRTEGSKVLMAR